MFGSRGVIGCVVGVCTIIVSITPITSGYRRNFTMFLSYHFSCFLFSLLSASFCILCFSVDSYSTLFTSSSLQIRIIASLISLSGIVASGSLLSVDLSMLTILSCFFVLVVMVYSE